MMRLLNSQAALALVRIAGEIRVGRRTFPTEILAKQKELAAAVRNAELFITGVGTVDYGMIGRVTDLRLELDTLYGRLAESEAA